MGSTAGTTTTTTTVPAVAIGALLKEYIGMRLSRLHPRALLCSTEARAASLGNVVALRHLLLLGRWMLLLLVIALHVLNGSSAEAGIVIRVRHLEFVRLLMLLARVIEIFFGDLLIENLFGEMGNCLVVLIMLRFISVCNDSGLRRLTLLGLISTYSGRSIYRRFRRVLRFQVRLQTLIERLNKVILLLLYVFFISVAHKIYILSNTAASFLFLWVERFFFIEVIEVRAVFVALQIWDVGRCDITSMVPVEALEEGVVLDLVDTVHAKAVICVTH